jgi:hypothetical protein
MTRTRRSEDKGYASAGAAHQNGGPLPIYICNTCQTPVVWCESKRTGRKYLVNVSHGYLDQRFYRGNNVHNCEKIISERDEYSREIRRHEVNVEFAMRLSEIPRDLDRDEQTRRIDEWNAEYQKALAEIDTPEGSTR